MVKVLISTLDTQGMRKNDFSYTLGAELLKFGTECDGEKIDGKCGCRRSMVGVESKKATTTMKVIDIDIPIELIALEITNSEIASGWFEKGSKEAINEGTKQAKEIIRIASTFQNGAVLEKRGNVFSVRNVFPTNIKLSINPDQNNGLGKFCLIG